MKRYAYISSDHTDSTGLRITCMRLMRDGQAVAAVQLQNGQSVRMLATPDMSSKGPALARLAVRMAQRSIPVSVR